MEVLAEQPELPELVGHVLADVGHRAVGSHDDFLARLDARLDPSLSCRTVDVRGRFLDIGRSRVVVYSHDPTALEASLGLHEDRARLLEELERVRPEVELEDVAFPREQVVGDVHPPHCLEMAADDAVGDEMREVRCRVAASLDVVQRLHADLQPLLVRVVPLGHARVEIPAGVVEAAGVRDLPDLVQRLVLELPEADRDVGNLHPGVVDVVLDFHRAAEEAEEASEGVAEGGVAQVADMRRLVRVDGRVLDDGLQRRVRCDCLAGAEPPREGGTAIDEQVDVAVWSGLDPRDSVDVAGPSRQLLRDRARGLPEAAGELEGDRDGEIAEGPPWWNFDRDLGQHRVVGRDVVQAADDLDEAAADGLLNR